MSELEELRKQVEDLHNVLRASRVLENFWREARDSIRDKFTNLWKEHQELKAGKWISTKERLPPMETPVLIIYQTDIRIGELRTEYPGFEDTYKAFHYWDDPVDDGQGWEWNDVSHWMPLPDLPKPQKKPMPFFEIKSNPVIFKTNED